jgi:DNA helicase-2/ATP-dependent DNA helicase PcrA
VDANGVFAGLNVEQRRAVEAVSGPVCILAGAGSGKTTTITRRIANQVGSGAFPASAILAVTFTDKAAGEMRDRLSRLGVVGIAARTFHAAALAQLHYFAGDGVGDVLPSKALILKQSATSLPRAFRFRPVGDLATEVEWAKNRRLTPESYLDGLGDHEPPIPPDLMVKVFHQYERRKEAQRRIDFEDLLELAIRLFDEDRSAVETFRERYRAFTVDEYQDVNLLQQTLLEQWLGERRDLCVVGDDYQSIYSFTGATPEYLLAVPRRFPDAAVVRLEENYRSTPEILAFANRLVPKLGGARKVLTPVRPAGAEPIARAHPDLASEVAALVREVGAVHGDGLAFEQMAVLYRINSQSEDFEEALSRAGIPYQVRGGAFLSRPAARQMLRVLRRSAGAPLAETVRATSQAQGLLAVPPDGLGEEEMTRQSDLGRLVRLAEEFDDGTCTVADFLADLDERFGAESQGRGVNLLTYHRAKGLEFEVVFLPRLEEGLLPFKRARTREALAEERRLLYVGLTRAKSRLHITWCAASEPSRFLAELGVERSAESVGVEWLAGEPAAPTNGEPSPAFAALRAWRLERARTDAVPAYVVFHDSTLQKIAARDPKTLGELAKVPGVGPAKLERYGDELLRVLAREKGPRQRTQ